MIKLPDNFWEDYKWWYKKQAPKYGYYRSIFEQHFPSDAAALSVPQEASVACSTKIALEWDEAFKGMNDPSGRAVAKVHDDAYNKEPVFA